MSIPQWDYLTVWEFFGIDADNKEAGEHWWSSWTVASEDDSEWIVIKRDRHLSFDLADIGQDGWELVASFATAQHLANGLNGMSYHGSVNNTVRHTFKRPMATRNEALKQKYRTRKMPVD